MHDQQIKEPLSPAAIREAKGWSQSEMAEFLGCNQSTVSRIERGEPMSGPISRLYGLLAGNSAAPSEAAE